MKTAEEITRIGIWYIRAVIENGRLPLFSHRAEYLLERFHSWLCTIPSSIAAQLVTCMDLSLYINKQIYTYQNIEMPDGKMYSKAELNYLAICN